MSDAAIEPQTQEDEREDKTFQHDAPDPKTTQNPPEGEEPETHTADSTGF